MSDRPAAAHLTDVYIETTVPTARRMWELSAPAQFRFAQACAAHAAIPEVERMFGDLLTSLAVHYRAQYVALESIDIESIRAALLCEVLPGPDWDLLFGTAPIPGQFDDPTRGA